MANTNKSAKNGSSFINDLNRIRMERDRLKRSPDNPFCTACKEVDCIVSLDGTCKMLRVYLKAKGENI